MSRGKKALLGIAVLNVVAVGSVLALLRVGDGGADADEDEAPAFTVPSPATPPPVEEPIPYEVQLGDTITAIAQRFDVTPEAIIAENDLDDPDDLREGQTLRIPRPPPLWLEVDPVRTTVGRTVELTLRGAKPGETITFEIHSPNGVYTGPPHVASAEGTVSTSYRTSIADAPGIHTIVATGTRGTSAEGTVLFEPADS